MSAEQQGQPFSEHLAELRRRVKYSAIAVVLTTIAAFIFHEQILRLLMEPAQGFANIPSGKPIYTDLTEYIGAAMKVSLLAGVFVAMPFVLYQLALFAAPGLSPSERRYLYALMPAVVVVFVIGAAFGYRVLFPPAITFLLSFGNDVATPYIRIGSYVNLMLSLLLWMGVVFELPIVLFFLSRDWRGEPATTRPPAPLRDSGGVCAGRDNHAHIRSGEPDIGRAAHHRAVRDRHMACEIRRSPAAARHRNRT